MGGPSAGGSDGYFRERRSQRSLDEVIAEERARAEALVTGMGPAAWTEKHYRVDRRAAWTPVKYLADMMAVTARPDRPELIGLLKGSQLGFSQAACALAGWQTAEKKGRAVVAMPNEGEARKWHMRLSKPMLEDIEVFKALRDARRDKRGGLGLHMVFHTGGQLMIQGAKTPDRYASFVADLLILDELDRYEVPTEGNPVTLSRRAVRNTGGVVFCGSTPTSAHGPSQIFEVLRKADVIMMYAVRCPRCGKHDALEWERIRFAEQGSVAKRARSARHECSLCGKLWTWKSLPRAIARGRWVEAGIGEADEFPKPLPGGRHVGPDGALRRGRKAEPWPETAAFAMWAGYSVWWSWERMVSLWLRSQDSVESLRAFVEQTLARCWRDAHTNVDLNDLEREAFESLEDVPDGQRLCIASIDVQQEGFLSALVTLWDGAGNVSVVDRQEFIGQTESVEGEAWQLLRMWLRDGPSWARRRIHLAVCDTGFAPEPTMINMSRMGFQRWYGIKGAGGFERPDWTPGSTVVAGRRVPILIGGVDRVKGEIMHSMAVGRIRVLRSLLPVVANELTSEKLAERIRNGRRYPYWRQEQRRNEALDTLAYSRVAWAAARVPNIESIPLGVERVVRTEPAGNPFAGVKIGV